MGQEEMSNSSRRHGVEPESLATPRVGVRSAPVAPPRLAGVGVGAGPLEPYQFCWELSISRETS